MTQTKAEKKGLLIVSHGYPPYYGGAEHAAGYLAREANRTGRWEVTVLTSDIGGRLPPVSVDESVRIVRVRTRKKEWARHTTSELISFWLTARNYQPDQSVDCILANCALPAGAVAQAISRRLKVPYGVVLQGSDVPGYHDQRFGLVYEVVKPWLRSIWREAAYVAAVSDPLRQLALRVWSRGEVGVIPNGVDIEKFHPIDSSNHDPSNIRLITVAQLIERKGINYLIEALAMLPESVQRHVSLEVCGIGPCEEALREQAKNAGVGGQLLWSGLLDQDELARRLRNASFFVLPTLQEAMPLSLLEAMASGLPIIATRVGGIPALVEDGVSGLLVEPSDPEGLCHAIRELASDPTKSRRMSQHAVSRSNQWAWKSVWEQHEQQMEALQGIAAPKEE